MLCSTSTENCNNHWLEGNPQEQQPQQAACLIRDLPSDCIFQIFKFFSYRELLTIESVCQAMKQYTAGRWKQLAKEKGVDFNWSELGNDQAPSYQEKIRYRLGVTIHSYIYDRKDLSEHELQMSSNHECLKEKIEGIYNRFKGTQNWSPSLWAYILHDLKRWKIEGLTLPSQGHVEFSQLEGKKAGDLLLKGLSKLVDYNDQVDGDNALVDHKAIRNLREAYENLKLAIERGAICAAFLATKMLFCHSSDPLEDVLERLSMITADKGNYQALEEFFDEDRGPDDCLALYEKYKRIYPIMDIIMAESIENENSDPHFDRAIKGYGNHVPGRAWLAGAKIKMTSADWAKANHYIDLAFTAYGKDIPYQAWRTRAKIKENCGDLKEAFLSLISIFLLCPRFYQDKTEYRAAYRAGMMSNVLANFQIYHIKSEWARLLNIMLSLKNENMLSSWS